MTLFEPLKFRSLEVKNRLFRSNISGKFDLEDGRPTRTRMNWERMFAEGGVGAIISSYVPVLTKNALGRRANQQPEALWVLRIDRPIFGSGN